MVMARSCKRNTCYKNNFLHLQSKTESTSNVDMILNLLTKYYGTAQNFHFQMFFLHLHLLLNLKHFYKFGERTF